jgi:hypothetical protein
MKKLRDRLIWFFGVLFGVRSVMSRPRHDLTGRKATVEDFRGH